LWGNPKSAAGDSRRYKAEKACAAKAAVTELLGLEQSNIFKPAADGQNLTRQQNDGRSTFDAIRFAAIFALLARGLRA
jgi:hypothetical protein